MHHTALGPFHPLIQEWFTTTLGAPTDVQRKSWPVIAAGDHAIITAPTGSGKTLTAFLWAIHRLVAGLSTPGKVRVVYVSPLKALNNDIARNLTRPIEGLRALADARGVELPLFRVMTRSGDTPEAERRRMTRQPPEILVTTPESLNLLLLSERGRLVLDGVETVILDEIHAIAGDKRGTYLSTAVERLALLSGEFQRIALSATVRPLEVVAKMVGGYELVGHEQYRARPLALIRSDDEKKVQVRVSCPENIREKLTPDGDRYPAIAEDLRRRIEGNRSTLLFTNTRKLTEKVARLINESAQERLAWSHHGALAREVRLLVEERLEAGELKAIVATNTLELGIDIGELDEVLLVNAPRTLSSGIQRVGRAGHGVGDVSHGRIYPVRVHAFVDAAVMAPLLEQQVCEAIRPVRNPLDVLAQVIVAMTAVRPWPRQQLYGFMRTCWAFHHLRQEEFDLVVEMLAGRYADAHIRELTPRVRVDPVTGQIRAKDGARLLLYRAGGVIPDRGYYNIRVGDTGALVGQLDEEFVWERKVGDTFTIGTQAWKIIKITHNDVLVVGAPRLGMPPFWRGESIDRDFFLCEQIGLFLQQASTRLEDERWQHALTTQHGMDPPAVEELLLHLREQVAATGPELPHRYHVVVEHYDDPANTSDQKRVILHALWGGRINQPLAICLAAAWEERFGFPLEVMSHDDCIALTLPQTFSVDDILELVPAEHIERLLRGKLESTGFFGARFRENAACALLLPKKSLKKRMPLWLNRLRAKKLLLAVSRYEDFPILVETWRNCLHDGFDLDGLRARLDELRNGSIRVTEVVTKRPSPFAAAVVWRGTDKYMYQDDALQAAKPSQLSTSLIDELLRNAALRPRVASALARELESKLQRFAEGYAPSDADDLLDLIRERFVIPWPEWTALLEAIQRDAPSTDLDELLARVAERAVRVALPAPATEAVVAFERLAGVCAALQTSVEELEACDLSGAALDGPTRRDLEIVLRRTKVPSGGDPMGPDPMGASHDETEPREPLAALLGEFLRFYGPIEMEVLGAKLGATPTALARAVEHLASDELVMVDLLLEGTTRPEVCDLDNLERLLRLHRLAQRPTFEPLALRELPLFLADLHGLSRRGESVEDLQACLERLFGFPATADAWESEILPARLQPYHCAWLDAVLQQSDLLWYGAGEERLSFCFRDWVDVFSAGHDDDPNTADELCHLPDEGRYDFETLLERGDATRASLHAALWRAVWSGRASNDAFAALRSAVLAKFAAPDGPSSTTRRRSGWKTLRPSLGAWYMLPRRAARDALDEDELCRERARQLFARYGVLFRERLVHEAPELQWRSIVRTLRLMEFSGEAVTGHFFTGLDGIQFADFAALRRLHGARDPQAFYWLNAADPVSLCGLGVEALKGTLPPRVPSTHLVYRGADCVMVSRRHGRAVELRLSPDDPGVLDALQLFKDLVGRQFDPLSAVYTEEINGEPARKSPYEPVFRAAGFVREVKELVLRRSYGS